MTQAANLAALGTNATSSGTFPATSLTGVVPYASMPTGSIIQVVTANKTDTATTTSSTLADLSGMTVSITPRSASNKIYVTASIVVGCFGAHASVVLNRNGSDIAIGDASGSRQQLTTSTVSAVSSGNQPSYMALMYLDSPSSTSSLTYKLRWKSNDNGTAVYLNRTGNDGDSAAFGRFISTITVMEVVG